jgi:hypothetical protein
MAFCSWGNNALWWPSKYRGEAFEKQCADCWSELNGLPIWLSTTHESQ